MQDRVDVKNVGKTAAVPPRITVCLHIKDKRNKKEKFAVMGLFLKSKYTV